MLMSCLNIRRRNSRVMQTSQPVFNRRVWLVLLLVMVGACASLAKTLDIGADLVLNTELALGGDIVLHGLVAITLGYATYWATPKQYLFIPFYKFPPLLYLMLCLVVIDEVSQAFFPQRQFSVEDMVINVIGLLFGAFCCRCWFKYRQNSL